MSVAAVLSAALLVVLGWVPARPCPGVHGAVAARGRRVRSAMRWPGRRRHRPDLAGVVTEVASRLRTGATPSLAWSLTVERTLGPVDGHGGRRERDGHGWAVPDGGTTADRAGRGTRRPPPPAEGGPGRVDGVPPALARLVRHCATDPASASAARTVLAASRLTHTLGAPLAEVLDRCAAALTEAEQARYARRVALAGPRSTARILAGLPLLGLLLGAGLGADPVAAATDGGWGTASVVAGLVLLLVGRRWTRALVAAAERPGPARRSRWWEVR